MGTNQIALPSGFVLDDNLPEGFVLDGEPAQPEDQGGFLQGAGNLAAGAIRGAGSIGATILAPADYLGLTGMTNDQRRAAMDAGLQEMGAQPESWMYKGGKLAGEIVGTAGAGGVLAKGVMAGSRFAPQIAPMIAKSLQTGGLSTGAPTAKALSAIGARNAAIRLGGGAVSGGAMAGLIDPEHAGIGSVIGGAIPGVVKFGGASGKLLKQYAINPLFKPNKAAISRLVEDAGGVEQARVAIDRAIKSGKTISGEGYTLGQAGKNAGLAATERARSAVQPERYQQIYQSQREARLNALQDIGKDEVAVETAKEARRTATEGLYKTMQNKRFVGEDDLARLLNRSQGAGALREAKQGAMIRGEKFSIPVVDETMPAAFRTADDAERAMYGGFPDTGTVSFGGSLDDMPSAGNPGLLSEIRRLGGVSTRDMQDLVGERAINKSGVQVGVFTKKGEEVGDMVRRLVDRGYMPRQVLDDVDGGAQALRDAIQTEAAGGAPEDMALRALYGEPDVLPLARETLMEQGKAPEPMYDIIGQAIKGGDLQSVKRGIDSAISATKDGGRKAELMQLKTDFLEWMGKQSPEYLEANRLYAEMSKPINQMRVAQTLKEKLTGQALKYGAEPKQAAEQYFRALKNAPSIAKAETGMRQPLNKIFNEKQLGTIKQVARELAKDVDLQNLGRGVGSDTAQKLARSNMLSSLVDLVNSSRVGRAAVNVGTAGARGRMLNQLDAMLQSPEYAGKALDDLTKPQRNALANLLANPAVRALPQAIQSK